MQRSSIASAIIGRRLTGRACALLPFAPWKIGPSSAGGSDNVVA
jgi:hypothetical protein